MIRFSHPLSFQYIEEIFTSINRNLIIASEKDQTESFNKLLDFILNTLISKSLNKSLPAYLRSVSSLVNIYPQLNTKYKEIFVERIAVLLVRDIYIANSDERQGEYLYLAFQTLISIFKNILEEDSSDLFNKAFESIQASIFKFKAKNNKFDYLFKFSTVLICWIYYLRFNGMISYEKYETTLIERLFLQLANSNVNFIDSFYKLYVEIENGFWHINDWEIEEPPMNKVYSSLMPRDWLPFSLVLILLKDIHLVQNNSIEKIELNSKFKYELKGISEILDKIDIDNPAYVNFIFPHKTNPDAIKEQLKYRKEKIIELFSVLKKKTDIKHLKVIQQTPLSLQKIKDFRQEVGKLWKDNATIINLIKFFDNVNYKKNVEEKDGYGFFQTLLKGKFAFIDGENHREIHGLSDFGYELARNLDNRFFDTILRNVKTKKIKDINDFLINFVSKKESVDTTIIFGSWEIIETIKNINYDSNKISFSYASFKEIPIVSSYNNYDQYLFIVDFNDIEIDIYESYSDKWYNRELLVDVTEYQKSEITADKIKEWNEKDKLDYSQIDVDVLESNNVNIKVLFKSDYVIKSYKNIIVLEPNIDFSS